MKIHVGSGTVYLRGWKNVDLPGPGAFLATERPDLAEAWGTTEEEGYYARHAAISQDSLRAAGAVTKEIVCDAWGSFDRLPCGIGEATEILARQVFEHLSMREARLALDECDRALAPGGVLRLDVPDQEETLKRYRVTGDAFFERHVVGTRRNEHAYHVMAHTRPGLIALVEEFGLKYEAEEPNVHFYPAFCLRFRKPAKRAAWQYVLGAEGERIGGRILEIGPGRNPWPRAHAYADVDDAFLAPLRAAGKETAVANLGAGKLPWPDKHFDFVLASHVIEHVEDPVAAAREIGRVGKAGLIVCPSAFKDGIFLFEEGDHRWWVLPPLTPNGAMGFVPVEYSFRGGMADSNASAALCRIVRTGPNACGHDGRVLRRWFAEREPALDVVQRWGSGTCFGAPSVAIVRW